VHANHQNNATNNKNTSVFTLLSGDITWQVSYQKNVLLKLM